MEDSKMANETYDASGEVDVALDDYVEPEIVRDLAPHTLVVVKVPEIRKIEVKGVAKEVVDFFFRVVDVENAKLVKYSVWLPSAGDPKDQQNSSKGKVIRTAKSLGLEGLASVGEFKARLGETVGVEVQAVLKVKLDAQYGDKNEIKTILS
jgi:hypothetical protein